MFKNSLKKRIKALESFFGLVYDSEDKYADHEVGEYGEIKHIRRRLKELETEVFKGKKKKDKPYFYHD